jgi:hypothetical protein
MMKFFHLVFVFLLFFQNGMAQSEKLGHFDTGNDLLITNYDSKPDVDDLMAVASFATMLRDSRFSAVNHIAVAGAYGTQGGTFIEADQLFNLSFGDNWVNAHANKEQALEKLLDKALATLTSGGDIWIAEAGQSDVSADLMRRIRELLQNFDTKQRIHLVQHSFWNESVTSEEALKFVRNYTDYTKIPDGNGSDNGTPNFRTEDGSWWSKVLEHPEVGNIWLVAQMLSEENNIVAGYNNEAIEAGGFDFSDTVEICWIFGFNDLKDVDAFFREFLK